MRGSTCITSITLIAASIAISAISAPAWAGERQALDWGDDWTITLGGDGEMPVIQVGGLNVDELQISPRGLIALGSQQPAAFDATPRPLAEDRRRRCSPTISSSPHSGPTSPRRAARRWRIPGR